VSNRIFGCYEVRKGHILEGIDYLKKSKIYFLTIGDIELLTEELNELGIAFYLNGDLETATYYFKKSLKTGQDSPKETDAILAEVNLAKVYIAQKKFDKAKAILNHYILSARNLKKWEAVANGYSVLADVSLNLNELEKAKVLCKKQLFYAQRSNAFNLKINAINNQALIYYFEGDLEKSILLFEKILAMRKRQGIPMKVYDAFYNLSSFYVETNPKLAADYIDSCIFVAHKNHYYQLELEAYHFKSTELKLGSFTEEIKAIEKQQKELTKNNEKERNLLIKAFEKTTNSKSTQNPWIDLLLISTCALSVIFLFRLFFKKA
ncbi:MAG: tetratricopeptide repeat protein, partial [Crocinitomicaceae bacterium]|nr:tetratricopeptide repeat protein [Crocinitomicaceae bacterium]